MATELKPIRTKADYKSAISEVERLWGAKIGTATAIASMCWRR